MKTSQSRPGYDAQERASADAEPSAAFTPGPWFYRPQPYDDWGWVRDGNGRMVAQARAPEAGELEDYRASDTDPYEANARLIAAAPDLYEALKSLRDSMVTYRKEIEIEDWIEIAEAALAHAEGRS